MKLKIKMESRDAAFSEDSDGEVIRILAEIASAIRAGRSSKRLFDVNGNRCGDFTYTREGS